MSRCRVAACPDDVVYLVPGQSSAAKPSGERSRECTAAKAPSAVEDLGMLSPDQGIELCSRLGVSFIGLVYERSLDCFSVPIGHAPGRLQRESSRRSLTFVLFARECHEGLAELDAELLEDWHEQFEVDNFDRSI